MLIRDLRPLVRMSFTRDLVSPLLGVAGIGATMVVYGLTDSVVRGGEASLPRVYTDWDSVVYAHLSVYRYVYSTFDIDRHSRSCTFLSPPSQCTLLSNVPKQP